MKQYIDLLQDVYLNGIWKDPARAGMPRTKEVFCRTMRFNMADGFPLLTTKKMFTKGIVSELLWVLKGDTNIQYLLEHDNKIWVDDCYKFYRRRGGKMTKDEWLEAVKAGKKFDKVLLKQGLEGAQFRELMELLKENDIQFQFVPAERLNRAVRGAHQGVLAYISQIDYVDIEQLVNNALGRSENPLLVILDGVSDVRNLGAIGRRLECAGGHGIIVPAKGGAAINADAVKASAGALMRMDTCKVSNLRVAAYYLQQSGFRLIAATEKTDNLIYDVDMTGPCAIIMGSEGKGISQSMLDLADDKAAIPMAGEITSLNVSVASAVLMYAAVRQRRAKG